MKCDYCPRVVHQKQCARIGTNHSIPFQCPACKESGNHIMTKEAMEYWSKREGKKQITIEEWLSKAPLEVRETPIVHALNNNDKPLDPGVMDGILGTPIWQISEARIHKAREAQAAQKAIKWIQEIMDEDDVDKVRIEAKTRDIMPIYILPCPIMIGCGVWHGRTRPSRAQISWRN